MSTYLVTYDLSKPGQHYEKVKKFLESFRSTHALQSVWFVQTSMSARALAEKLLECVDSNDSFVVTPVAVGGTCSFGLLGSTLDWLNNAA
ncbi:hypothetical protein [Mycobacteroides abscessus]|uniref:hypothetical protein n=1 Tax=Mycobacteroides abscessus TaxID=36809 RepID=UPI001040044D|nr:hypothetical protein [Mycobacteroides abscessus]MBN7499033.1 hypothetical protein [Mycobacteroides abscessus subsp. abscessus]MDO3064089.1 hypothetical protein [Mycobacteroides abscessus subsp. abscessus]MDO3146948.1 hypothetical protein [Mycobacteroides abscessus subsp. abscessus]MDO3183097.1 hypothetical protein [Mycobacteroides abscessus subsp. massiliense]NOR99397.1 hypothetical protein [Mycobacteroides abscessus]